ncbi:MAG: hypothetical protein IJP73_06915 [Bacteroidales bacterium]|nr:hypothetical protein [Bacteroidales bacterium]
MKRKIASDIFGRISIVAILAGCVEGLDGSLTAWTPICLAVAAVCGYASMRLETPSKTSTP